MSQRVKLQSSLLAGIAAAEEDSRFPGRRVRLTLGRFQPVLQHWAAFARRNDGSEVLICLGESRDDTAVRAATMCPQLTQGVRHVYLARWSGSIRHGRWVRIEASRPFHPVHTRVAESECFASVA